MSNLQTHYQFKPDFPKLEQVVNLRHQTPKGNQLQILALPCRIS